MSADIVHIAPELVQWGGIWGVNKASFTTEARRARRTTKAKPQRTRSHTKESHGAGLVVLRAFAVSSLVLCALRVSVVKYVFERHSAT